MQTGYIYQMSPPPGYAPHARILADGSVSHLCQGVPVFRKFRGNANNAGVDSKISYRLRVGVTGHRLLSDRDAMMEQAQRALETEGFATVTPSGPLLYRRQLTRD